MFEDINCSNVCLIMKLNDIFLFSKGLKATLENVSFLTQLLRIILCLCGELLEELLSF